MLEILIEGRRLEIELQDSRKTVRIDNREVPCDCVRLPDGRFSIILDGRVYELSVEISGELCQISNGSDRHSARIVGPRRLDSQSLGGDNHGGLLSLRADMPGKVVRVLVAPGDKVERDQGLLVLEAMKMQNEIRAPRGGTVQELGVSEGKTVASGDFLVSLE